MVKQGWVHLHRQLQDHWLWNDKPFSRGQAWVDLILLANHNDNKFLLGNELVEVKEGSFITSELKLMERWGWGKEKTRNFLNLLQADNMIIKKADRKKTTITIVNYSKFRELQTTSRPQTDRQQTTSRPRADTNKNEKNYKNDKNDKKIYSDAPELNAAIIEFVKYRNTIKKPMSDHAVKLMISKLNKMASSISEQIEILNQSILNGWQGIFPLKENQTAKKPKNNIATYDLGLVDKIVNENWENKEPPKTVADDENIKARAEALKKQLAGK